LGRFLTAEELAVLGSTHAKTTWLLGEQSRTLRDLYESQDLAVFHHAEMQRTLQALLDQQSRVERLKNFPYPRQYAVINKIFVWAFAAVLPFCLVPEFDKLNALATGGLAGQMAWMTVPFSSMLAWLYVALDQVGESSENPFQGGANDVPISRLSQVIEADLRMLLGERDHMLAKADSPIAL
jgi:putative membrane protein